MASEEPPCLTVGTEVSAKYRGAFCEAKVKKVSKIVKVKVTTKDSNVPLWVLDEDLRGTLKVGATVEVKLSESGEYTAAVVQKINDMSMYTVVFDDGDENTLRRTQLCLKGEKHFVKSDTLDDLPLTNPEHFGTPVVKTMNVSKRKHSVVGSDQDSEDDSSEDSLPCKRMYRGRLQDLIGRVLCIELEDRKGTTWVPVLVVQSSADDAELESKDHLLVKSFRDSKFYTVTKKLSREFTREMALKNEDKAIKPAFEKALLYYDTRLLPQGWDREELLGSDTEEGEDVDESSDNEPNEEKDHFVAQLYKFMDDRGTPINKAPVIASKDLNLYRLFRVVQNLGGYNRVTNQMKWRIVYSRMNLTPSSAASNQIKVAYKKYLHAFEDFYRKLGSTMGTISRPGGRGRHSSSGRSLMSIRDRESAPRSPRASKKAALEDVKEKKVGSPLQTDSTTEKTTEKEVTKSESRTKVKPTAAASESNIRDATSGATARESRSESRPETRASLEDRDFPRAKGEVRGREGVRKTESLTANLNESPRRRVSRLMQEHRKVAAREAKEREAKEREAKEREAKEREGKREQLDDSPEEGRKELRGRRREEEGKEPKEDGRRGKRDDVGKKEETKDESRAEARLSSPLSQRGKQEEGGKRESRGKQQELREEASKAGGKEDDKKGAAEKRAQKEEQEKEEVSDTEEKDAGKQKKRVTRKKVKEEVSQEDREVEKKTKEAKTEKPKDIKADKPKDTKSDKLKEVKADKPKEVKSEKPKEPKADKLKEVKVEKPKEVKVEKGKEVKLDKPKDARSDKAKDVKLEKSDKMRDERSENSDDSGDSKDVRDDKRQDGEYPVGTKLKVKYGRGRNQKLYEAKVVEKERESNVLHYRVHYDGWNKRYDEWIRKERIVGVVEEVVEPAKKIKTKTPVMPKTKVLVKKLSRPPDSQAKAKSPAAVPSPVSSSAGAPSRPTRSNSMEASLSLGLPMKPVRPRSVSGHAESSDQQTHTSESEGEEEEEENESALKMGEDKGSEASETNEDADVTAEDASPVRLPDDSEEKRTGSGKEEEEEDDDEEEETVVVEHRTLRRRDDVKMTSTPKSGSDVSSSRTTKTDMAVTMPQLSLISPHKDIGDTGDVEMEDTEAGDEGVGETKGGKETESIVGKDGVSQPDAAPTECPKIEKVDKVMSDDEKADKKQVKPRTRKREGARSKAAMKLYGDTTAKAEEAAVKSDDVGSDKDVTATEPEELPGTEMEEDGGDEEEKREKGRKRTKVTKEKLLEKTPKGKGKLDKADRPKGRPPKLKKLEAAVSPTEDTEVKVKKRVKRILVEKVAHDEEASSDLSEKEAPAEPQETKIQSDKPETKPTPTGDSAVDRAVPGGDVVTGVGDIPTEAPSTAQCASPDRQGSPTPEAPKLWDSVSVDVNAAHEVPAEKAPELSPVAGAGLQQLKHVVDSSATPAKPDATPADATVTPVAKPEASTAIFDNTPPSTPEHTSSATALTENVEESSSRDSPNRPDEVYSTKSEYEANLEVAVLMAEAANSRSNAPEAPPQTCESPIACDMSTMSNSSGGSSGNAPGSESEEPPSGALQKDEDDSGEPTPKRRKRIHKRPVVTVTGGASAEKAKHRLNVTQTAKPEMSDSDEAADTRAEEVSSQGSVEKSTAAMCAASPDRRSSRPSKYNFVEALEEGKYLEGEKRIDFLVGKIQEIRKIYMQLKAEVACIDRRRKRHRRRERESNKASGEQQQTPTSHMDIECS